MKRKQKEPDDLYKITFYVKVDQIPFRKGMQYHAQPIIDSLSTIGVENVKIETVTFEKPDKVFLREKVHDSNGHGKFNSSCFYTPKPNEMKFKKKEEKNDQ